MLQGVICPRDIWQIHIKIATIGQFFIYSIFNKFKQISNWKWRKYIIWAELWQTRYHDDINKVFYTLTNALINKKGRQIAALKVLYVCFVNYLTALFTGIIGIKIAATTKATSNTVNMTFKFKLINKKFYLFWRVLCSVGNHPFFVISGQSFNSRVSSSDWHVANYMPQKKQQAKVPLAWIFEKNDFGEKLKMPKNSGLCFK